MLLQCETMGLQPTPPSALPPSPAPLMAATAIKRKATSSPAAVEAVEAVTEAKKQCLDDSAVSMEVEEEMTSKVEEELTSQVEPKVIVEHQPLPSIYELQQNNEEQIPGTISGNSSGNSGSSGGAPVASSNAELLNNIESAAAADASAEYDSGMSDESNSCEDDEEEEEEEEEESDVADDEDEDEDDDDEDEDDDIPAMASPLYNSVLRMDSNSSVTMVKTPTPPKTIYGDRFWSTSTSPLPQFEGGSNNQRIECAENGKSYLQLGSPAAPPAGGHNQHHHLPVPPVAMQPKTSHMMYRRPPIPPPFRISPQASAAASRPVCDHSNCLQRRSSACYRATRARMLNLSLHKLHLARQNHDGCLRRSVLICNMLRKIEDETEREAIAEHHHHQQQQQQQQQQHLQQQQQQQQQQAYVSPPMDSSDMYWPNNVSTAANASNTTTLTDSNAVQHQQYLTQSANGGGYTDTYETALKDFNTAFRITNSPYASPAHEVELSTSSVEDSVEKGINWGSVLSLSSQSELDPLNNNSFVSEPWISPPVTTTTVVTTTTSPPAGSTSPTGSDEGSDDGSNGSDDSGTGGHSYGGGGRGNDIGWKLSADDVIRAFPTTEEVVLRS